MNYISKLLNELILKLLWSWCANLAICANQNMSTSKTKQHDKICNPVYNQWQLEDHCTYHWQSIFKGSYPLISIGFTSALNNRYPWKLHKKGENNHSHASPSNTSMSVDISYGFLCLVPLDKHLWDDWLDSQTSMMKSWFIWKDTDRLMIASHPNMVFSCILQLSHPPSQVVATKDFHPQQPHSWTFATSRSWTCPISSPPWLAHLRICTASIASDRGVLYRPQGNHGQTIVFSDLFAVLQLCCNFISHWSLQVLKKRSKYLKSSSKRRDHRVHGTISLQLRMMLHKWNLLQVNYRSKLPKNCWQVAWCWRHSELAFSQLSAQCSALTALTRLF